MMRNTVLKFFKIFILVSMFLINVACESAPFSLIGDEKITIEVHTPFVDPGLLKNEETDVFTEGNLDIHTLGTYTISYHAKIGLTQRTLKRLITVVDTTKPVITLNGPAVKILCPSETFQEEGFSALDNYDGDISRKIQISTFEQGLKYSISDSSNNSSEAFRTLVMEDKISPVLTLKGYPKMLLHINSRYREYGVNVSDNCDDLSSQIKITNNVDNTKVGQYKVTYTVKDKSGNTTTVFRDVEVTDQAQTVVYLTFDDGPSYRTLEVLDILKDYGVKATFFVGKKSAEFEPIMLKAYQQGHTVALHAYSHNAKIIYASTEAFFENLYKVQDWVESVTGEKSYIYRFPGGSSNTSSSFNPGIMTSLTQMIQEQGFHYFDWSVSSGDGSSSTTTEEMIHNVIKNIHIGRSLVVLMHDSSSHDETVAAVAPILDYLISIDAKILPITMDTPQSHHRVAN